MKELGQMREQRKALEHQISDLFALKAKHGADDSRRGSTALGYGGPLGVGPIPPHPPAHR